MSASKPLVRGEILVNDDGIRYLIDSKIGEGGFGHTYCEFRLSKAGSRRLARVCLKSLLQP